MTAENMIQNYKFFYIYSHVSLEITNLLRVLMSYKQKNDLTSTNSLSVIDTIKGSVNDPPVIDNNLISCRELQHSLSNYQLCRGINLGSSWH